MRLDTESRELVATGGVEVAVEVPEDPNKPGFDVLIGEIGTRTHYIHNAMAAMTEPLTPSEIGARAEVLARAGGYAVKETTFSGQVTRSHLVSMRDKPGRGFAEEVGGGRWQLTELARKRIAAALGGMAATPNARPELAVENGSTASSSSVSSSTRSPQPRLAVESSPPVPIQHSPSPTTRNEATPPLVEVQGTLTTKAGDPEGRWQRTKLLFEIITAAVSAITGIVALVLLLRK